MPNRGVCMKCLKGRHDLCPAPSTCRCEDCPREDTTGELERHKAAGAAMAGPVPAANGKAAVTGIVWEDPPPAGPRGKKGQTALTPEIQAQLRARPGEWGRIGTFARPSSAGSAMARIKKIGLTGRDLHQSGPDWELSARRVDGGSALWARYTGKS